ncbi:hypothetical protein CR513_62844, partial [Mucuna pruriens]
LSKMCASERPWKLKFKLFKNNGTWTMISLTVRNKVVGFNCTIEQLKVRLVNFGNHQVEEIDHTKTLPI